MKEMEIFLISKTEQDFKRYCNLFIDIWQTEFKDQIKITDQIKDLYFNPDFYTHIGKVNENIFAYLNWYGKIDLSNHCYENCKKYVLKNFQIQEHEILCVDSFGIHPNYRKQHYTYEFLKQWTELDIIKNYKIALFSANLSGIGENNFLSSGNKSLLQWAKTKWKSADHFIKDNEYQIISQLTIIKLYSKFDIQLHELYRKPIHNRTSRGYCIIGFCIL